MKTKSIKVIALITGILILAVLAGVFFFSTAVGASAQTSLSVQNQLAARLFHRGPGGQGMGGFFQESIEDRDTYLADALGISVEELQAAREQAKEAAIQQAVEEGFLTEEQADALREREPSGRLGLHWFGMRRNGLGLDGEFDPRSFLADALGISVAELEAAQQEAHTAAIQDAVEAGGMTQEQADLLLARQALREYLDPQALTAEALGITVDELQAYWDEGLRMSAILEEVGITVADFRIARQAARDAAIAQAVADGVISQDQADALQSGNLPGWSGPGGCGGRRGGGMRGFPREGGQRWFNPGDISPGDV